MVNPTGPFTMFIGHLPAGYIATKILQKKIGTNKYLFIGLIGSILPDFDIFYFYLIDNRQHLHHSYWIHIPFYWLLIASITFFGFRLVKNRNYSIVALIFFSNIFLHLILDTIVGEIKWLFPIIQNSYSLFHVPATFNFWVYNFIFHWTFLFELVMVIWAGYIFAKNRNIEITKSV